MIDNTYELILGTYLGIIFFFAGYFALGDYKQNIMQNNSLNWIFIAFFIILFFLLGYLFQNILLSFKDVSKRDSNNFIISTPKNFTPLKI